MTRPRLLDLFCGAGGCSVGYDRAGFDVTGVDISPHPDYPFPFAQQDALEVLADPDWLAGFDVIHASPPCPRYSTITPADRRDTHPDLVLPVLEALADWSARTGGMWVMENVPGAPLPDPALYCAQAMGLRNLRRHRLFASNVLLLAPGCACTGEPVFGIYGDHAQLDSGKRPDGTSRGVKARTDDHARELLGAPWVTTWDDLTDLIPPAYTEHVGQQLMTHLVSA